MHEEIANLVHPVLTYGLRLREKLGRSSAADLDTEQAALRGLLLSDLEAKRLVEYGGESSALERSLRVSRLAELGSRGDSFLGIRYALVCWLDEIFIDSPWGEDWKEKKLETALYGTNIRADEFWEQARRAEARPGSDALEVYYLCAVLGFRGRLRQEPAQLQAWLVATQTRLAKSQKQEFAVPAEHAPVTHVPPRYALQRFQKALLGVAVLVLILIPLVAVYLMNFFFNRA